MKKGSGGGAANSPTGSAVRRRTTAPHEDWAPHAEYPSVLVLRRTKQVLHSTTSGMGQEQGSFECRLNDWHPKRQHSILVFRHQRLKSGAGARRFGMSRTGGRVIHHWTEGYGTGRIGSTTGKIRSGRFPQEAAQCRNETHACPLRRIFPLNLSYFQLIRSKLTSKEPAYRGSKLWRSFLWLN